MTCIIHLFEALLAVRLRPQQILLASGRVSDHHGWRWVPTGRWRVRLMVVGLVLVGLVQTDTEAIQPEAWVHTTEADLGAGQTDDTVVTNLGDVTLATATRVIGQITQQATVIHDLQATNTGDTYLAIGPEGALLCQRGDRIEEVTTLSHEQVFALDLTDDGRLLVAASGSPNSRLAVLNGDTLETLVELAGIRYVWDTVVMGSSVYLATGTDGKLLRVDLDRLDPEGQPTIVQLIDAAQNNLLCLGHDHLGRVYAGTDGDGLVYRVQTDEQGSVQVFVLYDAPEPEIGALLVTADGTVYAGTADAEQARPGRLEEASAAESGRPETSKPVEPDAEPGDMPRVQPKPDPMGSQAPRAAQPSSETGDSTTGDGTRPPSVADGDGSGQEQAGETDRAPTQPNAVQWDRLRNEVRKRLEDARPWGTLNQSGSKLRRATEKTGASKRRSDQKSRAQQAQAGNAVYRISPDGFVTEVFRESVMILRLLQDPSGDGKLLVATGNEGQLFRVDPTSEETLILVDLEPQQVPAMVPDHDGRVLLGTANPASLLILEAGYATRGTYTGPVLDAKQISLWGKLNVTGTTPLDTSIAIETRSGNVQDPEQAAWSDWSPLTVVGVDANAKPLAPWDTAVQSPPARFLQYRVTLIGPGGVTPVVDRIGITYVVPNLKPAISSIQATYPDDAGGSGPGSGLKSADTDEGPSSILNLQWEATDPNQDRLVFTLQQQPAGSDVWLTLAQDVTDSSFRWQTRRVPDGRYLVRVIASDRLDNPSHMVKTAVRRTEPVLVDNSPPQIHPLSHQVEPDGLRVTGRVHDSWSPIRAIAYSVDSDDDWKPVLPQDLINDSTTETFTFMINALGQGPHVVTIRATDSRGNTRYEAILLNVGP